MENNLSKRIQAVLPKGHLNNFKRIFMEPTQNLLGFGMHHIGRSKDTTFVKLCKSNTEKGLTKKSMLITNNISEAG